jgi:hypothetical protein
MMLVRALGSGAFLRLWSIVAAIAAACLQIPAPACGQNLQPTLGTVEELADMGCADGLQVGGAIDLNTGYIGLFGISDGVYAAHVVNEGDRALMVPANQCARMIRPADSVVILSHLYRNNAQVREGYYYLMTRDGELLKAVHYLEGRSNPFVRANHAMPVIRADFESEKYIWLTRLDRVAQEARGPR